VATGGRHAPAQLRHPSAWAWATRARRRRDRRPADAAAAIAAAKTFDYATSCLADNAVVVHEDVHDDLLARLAELGGHVCTPRRRSGCGR
jgi:hypothetical protein